MNHSQVAVDTHHRQTENAGELVDPINGHHQAAHKGTERPRHHGILDGQERKAEHEELISDGQVKDVDVGYGFRLGVVQDDVDDQSVSAEADDAHDDVYERDEDACYTDARPVVSAGPIGAVGYVEGARGVWNHLVEKGLIEEES